LDRNATPETYPTARLSREDFPELMQKKSQLIAIGLVAGSNFEPSTSSASDLFRAGYHGDRLIPIRRIAANEKVLLAHHWTSST
jgi:hypothetical protein